MALSYPTRAIFLRAFLVALGAMTLFGLRNLLGTNEDLRLSTLSEVPAGSTPELIVQAEPDSVVILEWTRPNGLLDSVELEVGNEGQISYIFESSALEQAGVYSLSARYPLHRTEGAQISFEVLPNLPDLSRSKISFSSVLLSPQQAVQMSVHLVDAYGNPLVGHGLSVQSSSPSVQAFSTEFVTNQNGQMNFTLVGNGEGMVSLSLFDNTLGQKVLPPTQLALVGGPALQNPEVQLAESGPVDSFVITGLENETEAGIESSVTIKAIDEEGFTVLDYTGTIRFSSSDDQAKLPNDYTFLPEDQGEHTFSLGVKFVTLGEQTLTVTDLDDVQVNGEKNTTVAQDETASTEYNGDFETTDFERDGDFTLTSPATGSSSNTSIEVQGEAEYGNTAVVYVNEEKAGEVEVDFDNSFNYSLEDLSDGTYVIFVKIQDEEGNLIEDSDSETVTIDTNPPDLVSISSNPETEIQAGDEIVITVLSESGLEDSSIIFQEEVTVLEETGTLGKYQATLIAPKTEGTYPLDVFLSDALGNEVEYRDQLLLTVDGNAEIIAPVEEPVIESAISEVIGLMAKGGNEKVALSWEAPESSLSIAYYRIYYGPSPESLFAVSTTTDASTNWTITDLIADEYYYFAITAIDTEGNEGPLSDAVLGVPEAEKNTVPIAPVYPVSTTIEKEVKENPETGPASTMLLILSCLGAIAYIGLRSRRIMK